MSTSYRDSYSVACRGLPPLTICLYGESKQLVPTLYPYMMLDPQELDEARIQGQKSIDATTEMYRCTIAVRGQTDEEGGNTRLENNSMKCPTVLIPTCFLHPHMLSLPKTNLPAALTNQSGKNMSYSSANYYLQGNSGRK